MRISDWSSDVCSSDLLATDKLLPQARDLIAEVAGVIQTMPNDVIVRGHTDALTYASGRSMNNWMLSTARAEATRRALAENDIAATRFARISGLDDRQSLAPATLHEPHNRPITIP